MGRRIWVVVMGALAVVALPSCNATAAPRVLIVGDSLTNGAKAAGLGQGGPDSWTIDAVNGRTTYQAIQAAAKHDLSAYKYVIIAVGTNDADFSEASYRREIEAMMKVLGPNRNVTWINVDSNSSRLAAAARGVNVALQAATSEWHHLRIGDWNHYVTTVPGFASDRATDGTHYTYAGYQVRAKWTADLVRTGPQPR